MTQGLRDGSPLVEINYQRGKAVFKIAFVMLFSSALAQAQSPKGSTPRVDARARTQSVFV